MEVREGGREGGREGCYQQAYPTLRGGGREGGREGMKSVYSPHVLYTNRSFDKPANPKA